MTKKNKPIRMLSRIGIIVGALIAATAGIVQIVDFLKRYPLLPDSASPTISIEVSPTTPRVYPTTLYATPSTPQTLVAASSSLLVQVPAGMLYPGCRREEQSLVQNMCQGIESCQMTQFSDAVADSPVYMDTLMIDKYEVTNAQFAEFIASDGYNKTMWWSQEGWNWRSQNAVVAPLWWYTGEHNSGPDYSDYPVVGVSWYEADAFCHWAGKRLPSEAEWEWAARAPDNRVWPWGNAWEQQRDNWLRSGPHTTTPVNHYLLGGSYAGVVGLSGNVAEWVADSYRCYSASAGCQDEPDRRVVRGGSWNSLCCDTYAAYRSRFKPEIRNEEFGFRCAQ